MELRGRVALTSELQVAGGPVKDSRLEKEGSTWKGSPLGGFLIERSNSMPRCVSRAKGLIGA